MDESSDATAEAENVDAQANADDTMSEDIVQEPTDDGARQGVNLRKKQHCQVEPSVLKDVPHISQTT